MTAAAALPFDPIAAARSEWVNRGWSAAADGMAAVTGMMRAHQILTARIESVLKPFGITFARYEVLMLLQFSRTGSLPMRVIGSRLQVHPTSVTSVVDRLEMAGLVARTPHPEDRRATLITLTDTGRDLADRATDALNATVFERPGLSERDLRGLTGVLTRFRRQAGDF